MSNFEKKLLLSISFLICCIGLTACGENREEALRDYQSRVIAVLEGDPQQDTGVGQMLSITIGDLGCEGEICTSPIRFQFLVSEPRVRMARIADYRAQVCKPEFGVPSFVHDEHEKLCNLLQEVVDDLDAVVLNAANGNRLVSTGTGVQAILDEISNRLALLRSNLEALQQQLQTIDYLAVIMSR